MNITGELEAGEFRPACGGPSHAGDLYQPLAMTFLNKEQSHERWSISFTGEEGGAQQDEG